jgi:hypothetical protein
VAQRVKRDKLGEAIRSAAGVMSHKGGAMSREEVSAWVEQMRSEVTT